MIIEHLELRKSFLWNPPTKSCEKQSTWPKKTQFRQIVVNFPIATIFIFDKELKALREGGWAKAFPHFRSLCIVRLTAWNQIATIVTAECIIQGSDVTHMMHHQYVYPNVGMLFAECYIAYYKNGQAGAERRVVQGRTMVLWQIYYPSCQKVERMRGIWGRLWWVFWILLVIIGKSGRWRAVRLSKSSR